MIQEEKAKAYDKALNIAREILDHTSENYLCTHLTKEDIKDMYIRFFPELEESEDEKIRKSLISYLHGLGEFDYPDKKTYHDWLEWLEKQGESYTKKDVDDAWLKGMCDAKRELEKQDEQKTAEKIEPFDKYEGLTDFERTLADICIGWIGEEFGWKQYIKDNADVLLKIAVEKFNSVQDVPFEQKPAQETKPFKAEHGKYYYCIKDYFCGGRKQASKGDVVQALRGLPIMGLKDASEYFLPVNFIKCNSAWSEEDERMCQETIDWFEKKCFPYALESENPARESIKWLKSLKTRYTWKPSDEQIEALDSATENCAYSEYQDCLRELIGQLKKLREE